MRTRHTVPPPPPPPAPLRALSYVGWMAIVAFVLASVAFRWGAITRSVTLVVFAAALVGYAAIVSVLSRN